MSVLLANEIFVLPWFFCLNGCYQNCWQMDEDMFFFSFPSLPFPFSGTRSTLGQQATSILLPTYDYRYLPGWI